MQDIVVIGDHFSPFEFDARALNAFKLLPLDRHKLEFWKMLQALAEVETPGPATAVEAKANQGGKKAKTHLRKRYFSSHDKEYLLPRERGARSRQSFGAQQHYKVIHLLPATTPLLSPPPPSQYQHHTTPHHTTPRHSH